MEVRLVQLSESKVVNGLIVAAGLSKRMGDFKPLLPFGGKTLIECTVESMLSAGVSQVIVVLGHRGKELEMLLEERYRDRVILVYNPAYASTDMLTSVKCGLAKMPPCQAYFLLPGDMPMVKKSTFNLLLEAFSFEQPVILFPTLNGYPKHPPLINAYFTQPILAFEGEGGLRQLWKKLAEYRRNIPVEDQGVAIDFDTKEVYVTYANTV